MKNKLGTHLKMQTPKAMACVKFKIIALVCVLILAVMVYRRNMTKEPDNLLENDFIDESFVVGIGEYTATSHLSALISKNGNTNFPTSSRYELFNHFVYIKNVNMIVTQKDVEAIFLIKGDALAVVVFNTDPSQFNLINEIVTSIGKDFQKIVYILVDTPTLYGGIFYRNCSIIGTCVIGCGIDVSTVETASSLPTYIDPLPIAPELDEFEEQAPPPYENREPIMPMINKIIQNKNEFTVYNTQYDTMMTKNKQSSLSALFHTTKNLFF